MKSELKGSLIAFLIYLALLIIAALFNYIQALSFVTSAMIVVVPTLFGLLVYSLYYLPPICSFLVVLYRIFKYGIASLIPSKNGFLLFFILALLAHGIYWFSATSFKNNIYHQASSFGTAFEEEIYAFSITPIAIRDGDTSSSSRGFHSFVIEIAISNPLPRNVNININSTAILMRVKGNNVYRDIGTKRLHQQEIPSGYEGILKLQISNHAMNDIFEANGYIPLIAELDMRYSAQERNSLNRMIDISHSLCKWSIFSCPNYGGSYGFGPFSDRKVSDKTYQVRALSTLDLVDLEIFNKISEATYEFDPLNPMLRGSDRP